MNWLRSVLTAMVFVAVSAQAKVPPMVEQVAREQGVPPGIFYALVLAESQSKTQAGYKPWPWVINHRGQPRYFATQADAYAYTQILIGQGDFKFDAGIAQVNWRWHRQRFQYDLWWAFDPYTNLTVSAQILREQFERPECNEWRLAVGCYHRPAQGKPAERYAARVMQLWEKYVL